LDDWLVNTLQNRPVLVVGAGIMGAGIAQIAAQAGHAVWLMDARAGAAAQALEKLRTTFDALVATGKLSAQASENTLARITPIAALEEARTAALVVEAIVEKLEIKRALFKELEAVVSAECIIATNTSSISVTALANGMTHPGRLVGMHFFNPVPLMKLVEVISGLHTTADAANAIFDLSTVWGKTPVHARSTPGFIVNRIARPFYAEALALLQERQIEPHVLDAALRAVGFRMGPCELMDLIGLDTNFSVTQSVYEANFYDKRYVPSLVQREMVDGGLFGRKSGRGFYRYPEGAPALNAFAATPIRADVVEVHGTGRTADYLFETLQKVPTAQTQSLRRVPQSGWQGLNIDGATLMQTDGRRARDVPAQGTDIAVFDRIVQRPTDTPATLMYTVHRNASEAWRSVVPSWLAVLGFAPQLMDDTPGLVVARTLAMLINEAADAVQQGVCTQDGADSAMKLGVNYPAGPFEWLSDWSAPEVSAVLGELDRAYRGERYRVSPLLS
jgi:3-hydroxybutyryl-CoA dehydrogenase